MYKVVLVDDESIIVEGLRQVVDWAAYRCEVAACAYDAVPGPRPSGSTGPTSSLPTSKCLGRTA